MTPPPDHGSKINHKIVRPLKPSATSGGSKGSWALAPCGSTTSPFLVARITVNPSRSGLQFVAIAIIVRSCTCPGWIRIDLNHDGLIKKTAAGVGIIIGARILRKIAHFPESINSSFKDMSHFICRPDYVAAEHLRRASERGIVAGLK